MLNKANITWSCKQIAKMAGNATFRFDNVIQRSYVWERSRKSELIHSIIEGYPIPPFYAKRVDGKTYDFLDGKQRINALTGYINGEYALTGIADVTTDSGETIDINGKYFNDLPEDIQDRIKDYHLVVYYYEDITPDEIRILFRKLNNGKPLSTKERNIANCIDIATVSSIGEHELFAKILTEKALEKRTQLPIIMKVYMMLNNEIKDISFESKTFNQAMQTTKMTDEEIKEVNEVLDRYLEIYNYVSENLEVKVAKIVRKKMASETHMVSLIPFIKRSIDENISVNLMADFMAEIFGNDVVVSSDYEEAARGGAAKSMNIGIRNDEIDNAWEEFFASDEEDEQEEDTEQDTEDFMNDPETDND